MMEEAASLREEAARAWHDGQHEEAARLFGEAALLGSAGWEDLLWQAHALRSAGLVERALTALDAALAEAPAEPLPYLHRGHVLLLLGREAEARRAYGLAVTFGQGDPAASAAAGALAQMPSGNPPPPPVPPRPPEPILPEPAIPEMLAPETVTPPAGPPEESPAPEPRSRSPEAPPASRPKPEPPAQEPGIPARPLSTTLLPAPRLSIAVQRPEAPANLPPPAAGGIAFDVTDLLMHFATRRTLTGIQRVQASLLSAALRSGQRATYLAFEHPRATWRAVREEDLARLLSTAAAGSDVNDPAWIEARDAVPEVARGAPAHVFTEGQVLVNLGNSWGVPAYFRGLRAAQRAHGVLYVPFLHDCVPLVMPEHCVRVLVQDYARWFSAMGVHAHGVLCNSESTREDGRRFLERLLPGLDLPMAVVRLDGDPRTGVMPDPAALEGTRAPRPPEPYVLFVATIESRKDHLTVFRAWLSLLRRHGPARVPRLVCLGALGWGVEAAMNLLAASPELARHVVLLHGISDAGLAALYRDCLFTIYNSHYEGWGLPVTESMAWGKAAVVPRHSALIESGAGAAVFVEPQSEGDMAAAVERLLFEPGALAAAERSVAALGVPRPWTAVLADVTDGVADFTSRAVPPPEERVSLPLGHRIGFQATEARVPDLSMALSDMIRDGSGWLLPEGWGTPMLGGPARLRLPLPPGTDGSLRLHLELRGAGRAPIGLSLLADGAASGSATIPAPPEGDFATALPVEVGEGTRVLELELDAPAGSGLRALMLCRAEDLMARLDFLESQRLPPVRPT
ncbi:glycosyltransferase family 4 protein [Muricoccus aerilatus]|uniref:glycosyltransferase family 4 protein n=1 Tax=Muricoccus aerilatus TaxID=452982 RepID=UPI0005C137B4|nr:glycosyltransferase family 1 protein [Roseomonas aerilata]